MKRLIAVALVLTLSGCQEKRDMHCYLQDVPTAYFEEVGFIKIRGNILTFTAKEYDWIYYMDAGEVCHLGPVK